MTRAEEHDQSPEGQKKRRFLSASSNVQRPPRFSDRLSTTSLSPSLVSTRSDATTVEETTEFVDKNAAMERQQTLRLKIDVSWWDLFKGLISGPDKFKRDIVHKINPADEDAGLGMYDHAECPFILTVSVMPREDPTPDRHQTARCIFDTGCHQGNIVSLDFAHRLGYTGFEPLRPREQYGGTPIQGNAFKPEGALRLSWYHSASAQVFRDMRFLVVANANADLLVGVHSIMKYNLITPPNFSIIVVEPGSGLPDEDLNDLKRDEADLKTKVQNLMRKHTKTKADEEEIARLTVEYKISKKKLQLYEAEKKLNEAAPNDDLEAAVKKLKEELAELVEKKDAANKEQEVLNPPGGARAKRDTQELSK